jgi:Phage Mu protein F like protein
MKREQIRQQFATTNRRFENKYQPKVEAVLIPESLIPIIKQNGIQAGITYLHGQIINPKLQGVIKFLYVDVGLSHAKENYKRLTAEAKGYFFNTKATLGFNATWAKYILDYLERFLIEKITFDVLRTTRDELLKFLSQMITEGLGVDEVVKRIEHLPFTKFQAARIVRTEINRAANVGAKAQSSTFDYQQMKEWISAEDSRVRGLKKSDHASHVALDGVKIDEGDVFVDPINKDRLDIPGDIRASAASTINCRCAIAYTAKRDQNGRLIPKRQSTVVIFPNQIINRETILI